MCGQKYDCREQYHFQGEIEPRGHESLRAFPRPEHKVDVSSRLGDQVAKRQNDPSEENLRWQGPTVVPEAEEEEDYEWWQHEMIKGQVAKIEWAAGIKHIVCCAY